MWVGGYLEALFTSSVFGYHVCMSDNEPMNPESHIWMCPCEPHVIERRELARARHRRRKVAQSARVVTASDAHAIAAAILAAGYRKVSDEDTYSDLRP